MAINATTGGRTIGKTRRPRHQPMSEINVTPFVDVMLVLLIVFMVAAPLLTVGVPLELPQSQARQLAGLTQPITISIDAEGRIFLQTTEVRINDLVAKLTELSKGGFDERIYVRGDRTASYGAIMKVMGLLNHAGFSKIGLVTTEEQGT